MARLKALLAEEEIDPATYREMSFLFDHIWQLRFMNQVVEYTDLRKVNDNLVLSDLTSIEQQNLTNVLGRFELFREKIERDFFAP